MPTSRGAAGVKVNVMVSAAAVNIFSMLGIEVGVGLGALVGDGVGEGVDVGLGDWVDVGVGCWVDVAWIVDVSVSVGASVAGASVGTISVGGGSVGDGSVGTWSSTDSTVGIDSSTEVGSTVASDWVVAVVASPVVSWAASSSAIRDRMRCFMVPG